MQALFIAHMFTPCEWFTPFADENALKAIIGKIGKT